MKFEHGVFDFQGASWEGYVVEETLKAVQPDEAYFWATHTGAELDLLLFKGGKRLGVEVKRADAPSLTPAMRIASTDLRLDALTVFYPGKVRYALADRVEAVPITTIAEGGGKAVWGGIRKSLTGRAGSRRGGWGSG